MRDNRCEITENCGIGVKMARKHRKHRREISGENSESAWRHGGICGESGKIWQYQKRVASGINGK
jgi:hypothetical protein